MSLKQLSTVLTLLGWIFLVPVPGTLAAWAAEPSATGPHCHSSGEEMSKSAPASTGDAPAAVAERFEIPDLPVVDQDGKKLHFYRDLVAGRKVAINFVFTTCTTICPPMGAHFGKLEKLLAARAGEPVALISISIDPATDTPARLKAWRENFGAGSGWTMVTGGRQDVTQLLKQFRVYSASPAAHSPVVLIGDDASGQWQRVYGLTPPMELVKMIDSLGSTRVAEKEDKS